jgi:hypothetical protein
MARIAGSQLRGTTTLVSADPLTDKRGDNPYSYYTALVTVDQSDLEALPNVRLYPGMPATVMFPTVEAHGSDDRTPCAPGGRAASVGASRDRNA